MAMMAICVAYFIAFKGMSRPMVEVPFVLLIYYYLLPYTCMSHDSAAP